MTLSARSDRAARVAALITALGVGAAAGDTSPPRRTYRFNGGFLLVPDRGEPVRHSVLRNVSAIQHKQSSAFAPCRSRFRTCNADNSQQLDEFFIRAPKYRDKRRFCSLSFMYERQSPTTGKQHLSDPSRSIHDPDSGPRIPPCRLASVRFDPVSHADARTSPWGGFFVPAYPPSSRLYHPVSTKPVSTIQENDMVHRRFGRGGD